MGKYLVISALIILAACHGTDDILGDTEAENGEFEATVIGVEDCNIILLEFLEEDVNARLGVYVFRFRIAQRIENSRCERVLHQPHARARTNVTNKTNHEVST